jgi:hypothetical protein
MRVDLLLRNQLIKTIGIMALVSIPLLSFAKAPQIVYPWEKDTFKASGESLLLEFNKNDAQNKIQLKAFARESCYQAMLDQVMALPVDSTLNVSSLEKAMPGMEETLQLTIRKYGHLDAITYTSLSTASTNLYLPGNILAQYVRNYQIELLKKQAADEKKSNLKKEKEARKKAGNIVAKNEPSTLKESFTQELSKDTAFSLPYRIAMGKKGIKEKAAIQFRGKLETLTFSEGTSFGQWMAARPYMKDYPLQDAIKFGKYQFNKEKNNLQMDAQLDINALRRAFNKIENKQKTSDK